MPITRKHLDKRASLLLTCGLALSGLIACEPPPPPIINTPLGAHTVKLETVTKSVLIGGNIRPRNVTIIANKVGTGWIPHDDRDDAFENAQARLIYIIPEGTTVEPGDVLFELETTLLKDILYERENEYNIAEATYVMYREALAVAELQDEADTLAAQTHLQFARDDLAKYLEGDHPLLLQTLTDAVVKAEGQSESATAEYKQSVKLHANGYISPTDLESDRLLADEKQLNLRLARDELELFTRFTHPRTELELRKAIDQFSIELERTRLVGLNAIEDSRALMLQHDQTRREYKRRLDEMRQQIADSVVRAPEAGRVMYATSVGEGRYSHWPPLVEGTRIYYNEKIIHLITSPRVYMEIMLMEEDVDRVRIGQPVLVTPDLQPERAYPGRVTEIGYMA
ncbi:MAG: HlyD family secretion protein, partial [Planctomycetota bacterium]